MRQLELGRVEWRVVCAFVFLLVCLAVGIHCVEGDECLGDERDALLAFKSGLQDRKGRLDSWKGLNCCSWEGILCNPSNGHIITLDLIACDVRWALRGSINNAMFPLQHLEHLDLSGNDFNSTPIPPEIGAFKYLRYLSLVLSIPQFQLWGLSLKSCHIVGEIPSIISTQLELEYLDLSDNRFAGGIPSWLWDLPLSYLNVSYNLFNMPLPLPNSFRGYILDMSENQFNGFIPTQIGEYDCQHLEYLSLRRNNLSGSIPPLSQCSNLKILDLSDNHLSGSLLPGLSNCSYLKILNLANNELHGEIPEQLGMLRNLQTLQLSHNRLTGTLRTTLENCTSLQLLDMGHNRIAGNIPNWIGNLSELIVLSLNSNHFTGTIPSQITRLYKLQILNLSINKLEGEIPDNLARLQAMVNPPKDIYSIHRYQERHFFGGVSVHFNYTDCTNLTNKGQEMHYEEILSLVTCIDLSSNDLYGEIPNELGLLAGLCILNFSINHFKGEIPEELGGMAVFESLDVSENKLSGKIPLTLQSLIALAYLNVSNNKLSGRIPEGNQFLTFNASSFESNSHLCGRQLNKQCGDGSSDDWPAAPRHLSNASREDDEEEEEEDEIPWWYVGVGLSYAVGLSGVYFLLAMNRRWRREYFRLMDKIIIPIVVRFGFK
eukprot:Gb_14840 [translate_table: standard]